MNIKNVRYPVQLRYGYDPMLDPWASPLKEIEDSIMRYARLLPEFGYPDEAQSAVDEAVKQLSEINSRLADIAVNAKSDPDEPETLEEIKKLRPEGPRKLTDGIPGGYHDRFMGSIMGRGAGCTLGAALEFKSVEETRAWAKYTGMEYPPKDFWKMVKMPLRPCYQTSRMEDHCPDYMQSVPADDDTAYTLFGLLLLEKYGADFTKDNIAEVFAHEFTPLQNEEGSWSCYWGERNMLLNILNGVPADKAGYLNNPNLQSVAAWTRADTWGYVCPGWPEKAAELAFKDASMNHRRNGVYGSMFFAAAIAAAFAVDDPVEAIKIGLTEIPKNCLLAEAINWALEIAPTIKNYEDAARAVQNRYGGMFAGHAINCALFVVFGILIGGRNFTKVIGETVAMTFDNDCTGATSGSIVGAVIGKKELPENWYKPFNNQMDCYLTSLPKRITFDELYERYLRQAEIIRK